MFLPGEPGGKIYAIFFCWVKPKWLSIATLSAVTLAVSLPAAIWIREYTITRLPVVETRTLTLLPVFPRPREEVMELYERVERIVLVKVVDSKNDPMDLKDIGQMGMKRNPVLFVDIDVRDKKIISVLPASGAHTWGPMPMPTF